MFRIGRSGYDLRIGTVVGKNSTMDGHFVSSEGIRIDGRVLGRIDCEGCVIVGVGGVVRANINAAEIIINGEVTGDVRAERRIEITEGGRMFGNITSQNVVMAEGIVFKGRCNMSDEGESSGLDEAETDACEEIERNDAGPARIEIARARGA